MAVRSTSARVRVLAPAGVYLAVRLTGVAVLAVLTGGDPVPALRSWDGDWLLAIAQYGYAGVPADHLDAFGHHTPYSALGFFPGYPTAAGLLAPLIGTTAAGLLVSLVAGVAAAYALARLGALVPGGSERAGVLLVALFAAAPMGIVLSMAYTEALFSALAAWALVHVLQRNWIAAGAFAAAAGIVRPTSAAVVAAVGLAAFVAIARREDGLRPWLGGALAASGLLGYLGAVALVTGRVDGWSAIQRDGWGWYVDGGVSTAQFLAGAVSGGSRIYDLAIVLGFVASLVLLGLLIRMRMPWPVVTYSAVLLVTVWCSAGLDYAKLRLLVPAFPLLLPVALGLAARRTGTAVAVACGAALASAWFGAYALTIWQFGI